MLVENCIQLVGLDPSLTHTGLSRATYDIETGALNFHNVGMVITDNQATKTVRKNSDDLRRCQEIVTQIHEWTTGAAVIFSELPTGAQSARAAFSFGMVLGMMAGVTRSPGFRPAFMQVSPREVKLSIPGGSATTSKEEIIHWAAENWPYAGWKTHKKGKFVIPSVGNLTDDNEHMADACAVVNAGVQIPEFRNLCATLRHLRAA